MKKEHIKNDYSNDIQKLKQKIDEADSIIIGAGAGLSTSAGFVYNGERFEKYFSDFKEKYVFSDMYAGGFYSYKTPNEFWAFWSRNIFVNRYMDAPINVYDNLLKIVDGKDYFVITTNVDHCFQKSGFDKKRLFYTQGDYGLFQCSVPCCKETFDNESLIIDMIEHQENMVVDDEYLPVCPHCGKPLTTNLRSDDRFVEDDGWHKAAERYSNFIKTRANQKILFLELGVGYNTPSIIKYPFWQLTAKNPKATYACVNFGEAVCPKEIEHQSICINDDINSVITELLK
jgi:NAD-dependent SIR2 family protein deacetylase